MCILGLQRGRTGEQIIHPTDYAYAVTDCIFFVVWSRYDQRNKLRIAAAEFKKSAQIWACKSACLDLNCPFSPTAFKDAIDLDWLFAPVRHLLILIHSKGKTGVFYPLSKATGILLRVWRTLRMCRRQKRVIEHDNLRRSCATTHHLRRIFFERSNQIGVLGVWQRFGTK